jgi:hypothetical protein
MRDVIGLEIGDGTAQIMKTIVAREIIGKTARPYYGGSSDGWIEMADYLGCAMDLGRARAVAGFADRRGRTSA